MATIAETASEGVLTATRPAWILSRRDDLVWFQGSVVAGLALLAFFALAPRVDEASFGPWHPAVLAVLLWGILFDGTHVWATYARTYLAPDGASRAALPGRWSWAVLGVGPAIALLAASLFPFFQLAAYLWAYWHLVRQHYGFVMLYRRRAGESNRRGARVDSLLLWIGCLYPYLRFSLTEAYARSGLPVLVPVSMLASLRLVLDVAFGVALLAIVAVIMAGIVEPLRPGPKHLLLAIVIGFHLLVFGLLDHLLTILATLTIFHNLQYHRIVWQYERGLGRVPSGSLRRYLVLGLALGVAWYGTRVFGVAFFQDETVRNVLLGLGWGVAFHHYIVDGRVWRVRRSPVVARALDDGALAR
jgi:hypothetical protein